MDSVEGGESPPLLVSGNKVITPLRHQAHGPGPVEHPILACDPP